jgi:hypothetical protein
MTSDYGSPNEQRLPSKTCVALMRWTSLWQQGGLEEIYGSQKPGACVAGRPRQMWLLPDLAHLFWSWEQ